MSLHVIELELKIVYKVV